MSDKIVVMSEGKIQQIGTPEDIYNEPQNAFVADFIGDSNIFNGIMTGNMTARFAGGQFTCVDDVPEGTQITAVLRPEDIELTAPEKGQIRGRVTSVIFKGIHYEITVQSGRYEVVIQSTKSAEVGSEVGMRVEPDGIHIMIAEDHTNVFPVDMNKNHRLEFNEQELDVSLTQLIKGSRRNENHELLDENGEVIDPDKIRIIAAIEPQDIRMTDDVDDEQVLIEGVISNLIYKGDHYSYVINTDVGQDFIVDDEYLWNMGDQIGLILPPDKMRFTVKK
jgi:spermidine/putrescine transport system ATP-binding protein